VNGDLERVRRGLGRILAPEPVDKMLTSHDLVRTKEEKGEQGALATAGQRHGFGVPQDLEGSEDPETERHP
jgi:hypothetical protein